MTTIASHGQKLDAEQGVYLEPWREPGLASTWILDSQPPALWEVCKATQFLGAAIGLQEASPPSMLQPAWFGHPRGL